MTGRRLLHYEITDKLGEGGMGVVYKARDTHLDRFVAIKVMPPGKIADPARRARFAQEAKAASALNHPNIVVVHDISTAAGVDFIAMEYVAGKTLDQLIGRKGLSLNETLKYAIQITDALARAHGAGIVHRDLKPSNVMVDEHGLVKVLDFGLAKLTEALPADENAPTETLRATSEEGTIVGTAAYMSPEQAEGRKVDARSDVFSLGAVLYEMVTGRRAFRGDSQVSTLSAVLHQEPRPLEDVPYDLEKTITRCLRKDPQRRFQHMDDVRVALEELKEESDSGRMRPASGRRKRLSHRLLIPTVGLLLAAAVGMTWWLTRSARSTAGPVLRRLTSDSGLTTNPALSPDGKLLAYASDRSGEGNLDIWVRQVPRGEPIRLTRDKADESEPDFSPDGSQIVFRSEREGGGIYVMPALGGGEPRLVAREGRRPRFAPAGNWIAYWTGPPYDSTFPRSYKMFVVPVTGGTPRQLRAEFDLARFPTWSPEGKHLLFYGSLQRLGSGKEEFDWWVTPLDAGAAVRTEAFAALRSQGLSGFNEPGVWHAEGSQVVFGASLGSSRNLWRVPIYPASFRVKGVPERLTFGTGAESQPALAATTPGTGLVFANVNSNVDLWSLPIDANQGKASGQLERLTQDAAADAMPDISPDGRKVAFVSWRLGNAGVFIKDLASGQETALAVTNSPMNPVFSPDGSKVAYAVGSNTTRFDAYTIPSAGGVAEKLCDDCGSTYDWSRDGKWIVVRSRNQPRRVRLLSPTSGQITDYLQHPGYSFYCPRLSPDNRWLATYARSGATQWRLFIVPFQADAPAPAERDWVGIAGENGLNMACRWSPDGNVLYFTSERDGSPCIWAQRLNPVTKRPAGDPWPIHHAHSVRRSVYLPGSQSIAIPRDAAGGRMVFVISETTGNIWMAERK